MRYLASLGNMGAGISKLGRVGQPEGRAASVNRVGQPCLGQPEVGQRR